MQAARRDARRMQAACIRRVNPALEASRSGDSISSLFSHIN